MSKYKALEIWSNYINGNLTDFHTTIKRLSKKGLIDLIFYVCDEYQDIKFTAQEVLSIVYRQLNL
jgi:hypothetical protein